jgi:hypothetical protein
MRCAKLICLPMVAVFFGAVAGCGGPAPTAAISPEKPNASEPAHSADDKIERALAKLSDADRQAAKEQRICPVSGELLGSMGAPVKVHVKDRDVFICCDGCEEDLKKNPDEFLAKLAARAPDETKR